MATLSLINSALQALVLYLKLRNKLAFYDVLEKFDKTLDNLSDQREKYRAKPDQASQARASALMDEILEEKKKQQLFLADFKEETK